MEKRRAARYPICASAFFSWEDERGIRHSQEGVTQDISTRGAFILGPICPPALSPIELEIRLPSLVEGTGFPQILVKGRVVRLRGVESENARGFALVNERMVLRFCPATACEDSYDAEPNRQRGPPAAMI